MINSTNPKVRQGMDLVDSMEAEELNELVDYIRVVFKTKRAQQNARANASLKVGDRVRLTGAYKPQYLRGLEGEVTSKRNTRIEVTLDRPVGKFWNGKVICTAGGLTKIED